MAGFVIGGLGNAAHQYGQEVRGLLESRRNHFAELMLGQAKDEWDSARRSEYLSHAAALLSGKDFSKIVPAALKTIQGHLDSNEALANAFGGPPNAPREAPALAPVGVTPGTATAPVSPRPEAVPSLGSPSTGGATSFINTGVAHASPASAPSVAGQEEPMGNFNIPPVAAAPAQPLSSSDLYRKVYAQRNAISQEYNRRIMSATPAARKFLQEERDAILENLKPFEQQQLRMANLEALQGTEEFKNAPSWIKIGPVEQAYGFQPSGMGGMAGMIRPVLQSTGTLGSSLPQGSLVYGTNNPVDPNQVYRIYTVPGTGETRYIPADHMASGYDAEGNLVNFNRNVSGTNEDVVNPSMSRPHVFTDAEGNQFFASPKKVFPTIEGAKSTAFAPVTRTTETKIQTVDPETGQVINALVPITSTTRKGGSAAPAGGGSASGGRASGGVRRSFPAPPTASSRTMAEMAQATKQEVPRILSQVDALADKIGPAAGRWNEFWVNRAGINDPDYAALTTDLDLYASALIRTHFGARGGGEKFRADMMHRFATAQSPEDLKARINSADKWLSTYSGMGTTNVKKKEITPVGGKTASQLRKEYGY